MLVKIWSVTYYAEGTATGYIHEYTATKKEALELARKREREFRPEFPEEAPGVEPVEIVVRGKCTRQAAADVANWVFPNS